MWRVARRHINASTPSSACRVFPQIAVDPFDKRISTSSSIAGVRPTSFGRRTAAQIRLELADSGKDVVTTVRGRLQLAFRLS